MHAMKVSESATSLKEKPMRELKETAVVSERTITKKRSVFRVKLYIHRLMAASTVEQMNHYIVLTESLPEGAYSPKMHHSNIIIHIVAPRFVCSLLRQGMKQIIISLESPEIVSAEKARDKNVIAKQRLQLTASSSDPYALTIDRKSLAYALDDDIKTLFQI
ncbi:putative phospholipid-transporting ATPase 9 [Tanacetum coccineum]